MKRKRKNFLGCLGLIMVASMTIVAYSLPIQDASAESASDGVTISITVTEDHSAPTIHINRPYDGYLTANNLVDLEITYANADEIHGAITNDQTGESITFANNSPDTESNIYTINSSDLNNIGKYGAYTISATATNEYGFAEDLLSFKFLPILANITGYEENHDPILVVTDKSSEVDIFTVQAYKRPENTPLFNPVLQYDAEESIGEELILPFTDNNAAPNSEYNVEILSYTGNNGEIDKQLNGPITTLAEYAIPETPDTPNTGAFFKELNITQSDYLISGLIIFITISIGLIILTKKSSRR